MSDTFFLRYLENHSSTVSLTQISAVLKTTHQKQLLGYVLAAQTEFAIIPSKTTTKAVYISENKVKEATFKPTLEEIETYKEEIANQAQEMYSYCADVDANKPRDILEFPMTSNEKVCTKCNFKEYCGRA